MRIDTHRIPHFKSRPGDKLSWGLSWFSSVPPGECWDSTLKLAKDLSNPFQFIIHLSSFHSTLYILSYRKKYVVKLTTKNIHISGDVNALQLHSSSYGIEMRRLIRSTHRPLCHQGSSLGIPQWALDWLGPRICLHLVNENTCWDRTPAVQSARSNPTDPAQVLTVHYRKHSHVHRQAYYSGTTTDRPTFQQWISVDNPLVFRDPLSLVTPRSSKTRR
jgi:hypothetical protein